jgi:hypothetical protein
VADYQNESCRQARWVQLSPAAYASRDNHAMLAAPCVPALGERKHGAKGLVRVWGDIPTTAKPNYLSLHNKRMTLLILAFVSNTTEIISHRRHRPTRR